jgi:hypothetical protein
VEIKREVGTPIQDLAIDETGRLAVTSREYPQAFLGDTSLVTAFTPVNVFNPPMYQGRYLWVTFARPVPSTVPTPVPTPPSPYPPPKPLNPNNIIVGIANALVYFPPLGGNTVREFTPDGTLVQTIQLEYGFGPYRNLSPLGPEYLHGIVVDQTANIDAFNGTNGPFLTRLNLTTDTFTHFTFPGWAGFTARGAITGYGNFLFVTDDDGPSPFVPRTAHGIIRFNTVNGDWVRFASDKYFSNIAIGADGKLYTLPSCESSYCSAHSIEIYDPVSLALLRTVPLPIHDYLPGASAVTADQSGRIFVLPSDYAFLFRLTRDGVLDVMKPLPILRPFDVHVDELGRLLIGAGNNVIMCDADLQTDFVSFPVLEDDSPNGVVSLNFARAVPAGTPTPTPTPMPTPTPTPPIFPLTPPTVTVASSGSVVEGGTGQFVISAVPANPSQPTVVSFSITGKAGLGLDYTIDGNPSQVTIPAGASSAAVTLHALTDATRERSEKITLTLFQGSNYALSRTKSQRKATMSIINVGGSRGRR